jgi:hypothetical protein
MMKNGLMTRFSPSGTTSSGTRKSREVSRRSRTRQEVHETAREDALMDIPNKARSARPGPLGEKRRGRRGVRHLLGRGGLNKIASGQSSAVRMKPDVIRSRK